MLSDSNLQKIVEILIGDTAGFYPYKSGLEIVNFFNDYFEFKDIYGQGFPSRWAYTVDALKRLWNAGKFDDFLSLILSPRYLQNEFECSKVEATQKLDLILPELRKIASFDNYIITHVDDKYHLVLENDDLILIGAGGFAHVYKQKSTGLVVKTTLVTGTVKKMLQCYRNIAQDFDVIISQIIVGGTVKKGERGTGVRHR